MRVYIKNVWKIRSIIHGYILNAVLCFVSLNDYVHITFENNCNNVSEMNTICLIGFYPVQE